MSYDENLSESLSKSKVKNNTNDLTIDKIKETAEKRIKILKDILNVLNDIVQEEENTIDEIEKIFDGSKEKMFNLINSYNLEDSYQQKFKNLYDMSLKLKNENNNFQESKKNYQLNCEFNSTFENQNFIDMIKINNSRIAIRSKNLIIFEDLQEDDNFKTNSFKVKFENNNNEIIFFCAYQEKNVLVSLKGESNSSIQLVDLEKNRCFELFSFKNQIIYISPCFNENEFILIEEPNILIYIKDQKIDYKNPFDEEIKSVIQLSENHYCLAKDNGYIIFDMKEKKITYNRELNKKILPQYICLKENYVILCENDHVDLIKIDVNNNDFTIASRLKIIPSKFYFSEETSLFCIISNNKISIYELIPDKINVKLKIEKPYNKNTKINSVVFLKPEKIVVLSNGNTIQLFYIK